MSRTRRPLMEFVEEYMMMRSEGDLDQYITKQQVLYYAKMGIRDMSRTVGGTPKTVLITPNSVNFVEFPNDYLTYTKIGYLDQNNEIRTLGRNDNINTRNVFLFDFQGNALLDSDGIELQATTVEGKTNFVNGHDIAQNTYWNVLSGGIYGHRLGVPGGVNKKGHYRVLDEGIELSGEFTGDIVLEYIADETMRANPFIYQEMEEPLRSWIFYQYIRKRFGVPENRIVSARKIHYNERRVAKMKMRKFTLEELVSNSRVATTKLSVKA